MPNHMAELQLQPDWEYVADTVMGGASSGTMSHEVFEGNTAAVLRGDVSLDNNGGFIQMAFDLRADGAGFDASDWDGVALEVWGNNERYDLRLRTDDLTRPWQSFRTDFATHGQWQTIWVPFDAVAAHKTDAIFNKAKLRRIGILAIGKVFTAKIAIAKVQLYRA